LKLGIVVAVLSGATTAHAQTDIAGQAVWFGNHKPDIGDPWNSWYSTGAGSVTVGHHWTPHLRTEIAGTVSRAGRIYDNEPFVFGGRETFRAREHVIQATTVAGGVTYQFFQNQWFHPFVGGGVELVRERQQAAATVRYDLAAQPFATAGLKAYVSPRAFVRTEVTASANRHGVSHVSWAGGIGVELAPVPGQPRPDAEAWRTVAQGIEAGTRVRLRLRDGRRLDATLIGATDTGVAVQPRTRVPVNIERVPYSAIVSLERDHGRGAGVAKAVAIGAAVGGGTFLGLLMLALSSWD
jgi:hypothetical protein